MICIRAAVLLGSLLCFAGNETVTVSNRCEDKVLIVADQSAPMGILSTQLSDSYPCTYVAQDKLQEDISNYTAVFMYIHDKMTARTEQILINYTEKGGKLVILHHGIASARVNNPDWLKMTGIYISPRNDKKYPWKVIPETSHFMVNLNPDHFITSHKVVYDCEILYKSSDQPSMPVKMKALEFKNTEVFLNQHFTDGREKTLLFGFYCKDPKTGKEYHQDRCGWYKKWKKGWIFYYQPGHAPTDFQHPSYIQIIKNTLQWNPKNQD